MDPFQTITSRHQVRGTVMKAVISLAAGAAMLALAGTASAESINIGGNAAAICSLPGTWQTRTNIGGALGTFAGNAWGIPSSEIANTNGTPNVTGDIALRISGLGYCNTPHTIRLSSLNGSLHHSSAGEAPSGFTNSLQVKYDAHWAKADNLIGPDRRYGPSIVEWSPTGPGQSQQVTWSNEIPGSRNFDLRMAIVRSGSANTPLVAGNYSDTVTVTLSPNG